MSEEIEQATERFKKHLESGFYRDRSGKPIVVKESMSEEMSREQAIGVITMHREHWRRLLQGNVCSKAEGEESIASFDMAITALSAEPCSDAISRAEAQTEIMMFAGNCKSDEEEIYIKVSDAVQLLRDLPSVHAETQDMEEYSDKLWKLAYERGKREAEPRTGHWRHGKHTATIYEGGKIISEQYSHWFCGSCGYLVKDYERPAWNYCPNCGAKMEADHA